MPWVVGETAETLPRGRVATGAGLATLAPPDHPLKVLPVPQVWARLGVSSRTDLGLVYAAPASFALQAKVRAASPAGIPLAALAGAGLHIIPDVLGEDVAVTTPFALLGVVASAPARERRATWYGALRGFFPAHLGDDFAITLWLVGSAGAAWTRGSWQLGPELGVVMPTTDPEGSLVLGSFSVRRRIR